MSDFHRKLHRELFRELGEAEYKLARWNQSLEPWHYWSREAIEAALSAVCASLVTDGGLVTPQAEKILSEAQNV